MNSKNNNMADMDDDLKFMPLNLKEPFKSKDSSWTPCINLDIPTNHMTNNFFMPLPDIQPTQSFNTMPNMMDNQIPPYSSNFPTQSTWEMNNGFTNMDLNNNSNFQPNTMQPNNMQPNNMQPNSSNNLNQSNIVQEDELYPSEVLEDELFSYNTNNPNSNTNNNFNNNNPSNNNFNNPSNNNSIPNTNRYMDELIHLDILRDFDFSIDSDINSNTRGSSNDATTVDKIFRNIEDNNDELLETFKSYKIPYPMTTLVIKKIITASLDYCKEE